MSEEHRSKKTATEKYPGGFPAFYRYALAEAARLGLTLSLNIQSGWNLGGPDVTPEEAAKHLTRSGTRVKGPTTVRLKLAWHASCN